MGRRQREKEGVGHIRLKWSTLSSWYFLLGMNKKVSAQGSHYPLSPLRVLEGFGLLSRASHISFEAGCGKGAGNPESPLPERPLLSYMSADDGRECHLASGYREGRGDTQEPKPHLKKPRAPFCQTHGHSLIRGSWEREGKPPGW